MCTDPSPNEVYINKLSPLKPTYDFCPSASKSTRYTVSVVNDKGEILTVGANSRERAAKKMCEALAL
jgi:hypothetical protein